MEKFYDNGVTIITIISIILACLITSLKIIFKSKCTDVSICYGIFHIQRNVELETEIIDNIPIPINNTLQIV